MKWREQDGLRWLEAELPRARAGFSTRLGGVSAPPYDTLNVAVLTGDSRDDVRRNRHLLAGALGIDPGDVLIGRQVHGAELEHRDSPPTPNAFADPGPELPDVDAQATATPGLAPLVMVADCLPVAVSGPGGVAMLHCGWRGLAAGVIERGVREVHAEAAAIGPGIGPCHYEVGDEVLEAFSTLGDGIADGRMLDLREVARRMLDAAGVGRVEVSELCTSCEPELFFSHRRDNGVTGRQAGVIWRT